jgi:hypothetical protein
MLLNEIEGTQQALSPFPPGGIKISKLTIILKKKKILHYHICQGEGWICEEERFTELPSSEIITFLIFK